MLKLYNKKLTLFGSLCLLVSNVHADIPYCNGTQVTGSKHIALQAVVQTFAIENNCKIGNNCLHNFDKIKYSIAWSEPCWDSAARGNDEKGSTFLCTRGYCTPYGFFSPYTAYEVKFGG